MAAPMTSIISTYLLLNADLTKESRSNVDLFNDLIPILYDPDLLAHHPEKAFEDQISLNTCLQDLYAVVVDVAKVNKISR